MHLVFLNQYYPPDAAPTGVMLQALVENLVARGHEVTVICAAGGYAENAPAPSRNAGDGNGVRRPPRIIRIAASRFGRGSLIGKLADYASYYIGTAWTLACLRPGPDRIVALTTPPYLSVLARLLSRLRGADHAHWVMDLYPDVMLAHGMTREKSPLYRTLRVLARWGCGGKRNAGAMTIGPDIAGRLATLCAWPTERVKWIPLWSSGGGKDDAPGVDERTRAMRKERGWADDETVVMYSGNMGLGHLFEEILGAARQLAGPPSSPSVPSTRKIRFVFFGDGRRRKEIERFITRHPGWRVELHGYSGAGELDAHLRTADIHLASLRREWTGMMVPSKLQGIFTAARPVIFIGDPESSIGQWIRRSGGGWVVSPGDRPSLANILSEAATDTGERIRRGKLAASFAETHFRKSRNVSAIAEIFTSRAVHPISSGIEAVCQPATHSAGEEKSI